MTGGRLREKNNKAKEYVEFFWFKKLFFSSGRLQESFKSSIWLRNKTAIFFKVVAYDRDVVAMPESTVLTPIAVVEGVFFEIDFPSHIKVQNTCSDELEDTHKTW